ncbi:zinc ABC transporter ATP-binding protein ZurA [Gottschalkia purinilytica]|uniref:Zinc ABC transporter ATP-binding protein ZurA n=1 Tax=Gottschalkia purinilytica TaxID=1503 RepID=A0A0L0WDH9_GOTPU|nr:metal ABC transporter ATP-binding protein [Gottschalkia purinilytica]KNF09534.1 zinc ABC transporter ATP-binding protein ZurA [Gottschalkia purinilytica]
MSDIIVDIKNLNFSYDNNQVLKNINLKIYKGDYIGIIGSNGSAKSTLLKLMLGLLKPDSGEIKIFNKSINNFNSWHNIGYLSQQVRSFNSKFPATVEEVIGANLHSQMGFLKFLNKKHKKKIYEVLKIVDMEEYKDRLIGSLSGGQQQRVFIARLLISNPKIIFMDEPLVGVDIKSQGSFYRLMEKLNKEMGITLVMVTHDVGEISEKANKVACLNDGQIYFYDAKNFAKSKYLREIIENDMNKLGNYK